MGTLLRTDCTQDYSEDNSFLGNVTFQNKNWHCYLDNKNVDIKM